MVGPTYQEDRMSQLTALDAQFLHFESATTAAHVAGVAVLDPGTAPSGEITRDSLAELLRARMHLSPALHMRLAEVPLGLDHPYWTPDTEFDLDHHLFESTLPAPGGDRELAAQPAKMLSSLAKVACEMDAIPVISDIPGSRFLASLARRASGDRRTRPELPSLHAPDVPINGPITGTRAFAYGSVPFKDVKQVATAFGLSVNDVILALCASALRTWLLERDALPEQPLIVAVPVAVRASGADEHVGNQISAMITPLATQIADPAERLRAVGEAMGTAKRRFAVAPTSWLNELCSVIPAPLTGLAMPTAYRLAAKAFPPVNLIISNVPGPQFPLYLCGGRVLSYYPVSVLSDISGGRNITCFSYDGAIDFGLVTCPDLIDDGWTLMAHLHRAMDEMTGLLEQAPN